MKSNNLTGYSRNNYRLKIICPICEVNLLPIGYPGAISREDNQTEICSPCGLKEGLRDWVGQVTVVGGNHG